MNSEEKEKKFACIGEKVLQFMSFCLSEESNPQQICNQFESLAFELFNLQRQFVKPYRNFCQLKGEPDDWQKIPCLPTSVFKEFEITSLYPEERKIVFLSSGTTYEKSSRHFHNENSVKIYEKSLLLWFKKCLLNDCKPLQFIMLTPPPDAVPHSSLVYMLSVLKQQFGGENSAFYGIAESETLWKLNIDGLINELGKCQESPLILMGTAFNFVHLIDYLEQKKLKFKLPSGSIIFETGGYKGRSREIPKKQLYSKIAVYLGVSESNIVSEYGMSELSSQAYDSCLNEREGNLRVFKFPPWARYKIISPETKLPVKRGERGILQIYDLANVYSLMAIQTDDIAIECGNGFILEGRAGQFEPRGCSLMLP